MKVDWMAEIDKAWNAEGDDAVTNDQLQAIATAALANALDRIAYTLENIARKHTQRPSRDESKGD